jgi:hypothetical protein
MRRTIVAMTNRSNPQPYDRSTSMNIRSLFAAVAFVSLAAPLAAQADAPSGEINTIYAIDLSVKAPAPKFDRREHRTYVEDILAAPTAPQPSTVTREQVRKELAAMPQERVGG